jgi:sodium transport system ATP-binding protein
LRRLRDEAGKCIVFSSHIMQEVERLCDEVVVVSHGRTVAHGTVAGLCAQTGHDDFEECFVDLAFTPDERAAEAARQAGALPATPGAGRPA